MSSKRNFVLAVALLLALVLLTISVTKKYHQTPKASEEKHIELGAWTQGFFDSQTQTLHPEKLTDFENMIQRKLSLAHYYLGWEYLENPKLLNQFETIRNYGWQPVLNVNPYYFQDCPPSDLPLYRAIAEGQCDTFLHKAGKNLSRVKQPFYLLFAWEMNNPQNTWSLKYTDSNSEDFIAAWRHIHDVFEEENAKNVIWVFCPNVPNNPDYPYQKLYPGNSYVDWIGLDGYNWGNTQPWSEWTSFSGVFGGSYYTINKIAPNKPLMIAEVNSTDKGGNKGLWYEDMLNVQIPNKFPKIKAIIFFNEDRTREENVNWKIDVNQESLKDFISATHNPLYD